MSCVKLATYDNSDYKSGSSVKKLFWYFTNMFIFKTMLPIPSKIKINILKFFGAKVGYNAVIKPNINIKYPWFLEIGNDFWIGAKSVVCPNVTCKSHSVVAVGSIVTSNLDEFIVYQGNLAVKKREREIV